MPPFKTFLLSLASFLVLDLVWFGQVVKNFNLSQLSQIGRIRNGEFEILYFPAALTYVLMAIAVTFFVLPRLDNSSTLTVFMWGALMGLIIYGVFDLTNLAILRDYPVKFVFADMAWGAFSFGVVTLIAKKYSG